jgi:phage gpG-like protein
MASIDALEAALRQVQARAAESTRQMAITMGAVGERAIKAELSRSSHPAGTKTPSQGGVDPPSLISGRLRGSVRRTRLYPSGPYQWTARVAPTTVYARIQELGGWTGRGHRSHLPPRPYVRPAIRRHSSAARDAAIKVFRQYTGL